MPAICRRLPVSVRTVSPSRRSIAFSPLPVGRDPERVSVGRDQVGLGVTGGTVGVDGDVDEGLHAVAGDRGGDRFSQRQSSHRVCRQDSVADVHVLDRHLGAIGK